MEFALNNFLSIKPIAQNNNITPTYYEKRTPADSEIDPSLLQADEEKQLFDLMKPLQSKVAKCLQDKDYTTALEHVATLRGPVDAFFEKVMVMDENPDMKKNRLALLSELARLCHCVMPIASLVN